MKIALCLSGQPRFIERAYPSIYDSILAPNSPDVFVHTWFDKSNLTPFRENNNWQNCSNNKPTENVDELIHKLYNPIGWLFEPPATFKANWDLRKTISVYMPGLLKDADVYDYTINMMHCMWYSIYQSNHIKERYRLANGFEYDMVIRCRFDSQFSMKIDCSKYDPSVINVGGVKPYPWQTSDWFAMGGNNLMNIYSSVFPHLDYYYQKRMSENQLFSNEDALFEHLKHFNAPTRPIDGFAISFVRPWN